MRGAIHRVEKLSQQVEQIRPAVQTPAMMGLTVPVQIDIDMRTGCTNTTSSEEINIYKFLYNAIEYIDEV